MIKEYINNDIKLEKERVIGITALIITLSGVIGWLYEVLFYYLESGFKNIYFRGGNFLPWINIYAIGALLIIGLTYKFRKKPLLVFLVSMISTGVLELISGYLAYGVFHMVKCWDYNVERFSGFTIGGYVCIRSVICFGLSGLLLMYLILPLLIRLSLKFDKKKFMVVSLIICSVFLLDELYNQIFTKVFGLPRASSIYKKLGIKKEKVEVKDEEVEHELGHLKEQFAELKTLDDKAKIKEGNVAVIDFEGFKDGVAFKGGKGENYNLEIGSHSFIPGFEEALVGLKKGDKKDVELTFPKDYHSEELKGKKVVFKVEIKEIKERVFPEFNKEFFEDLNVGGVTSLDELKNYIKENMKAEKEQKLEDEYLFKCLDKIVEDSKFEIPVEMTNDEVNRLVKEFSQKLQYQGLKFEDYLKFTNAKEEDFKKTLEPEANKRIGYRLVMDAIIEKEKLEVSDEELETGLEEKAKEYGMSKEDFIKEIGTKELFKYDMLMRKAMKFITE